MCFLLIEFKEENEAKLVEKSGVNGKKQLHTTLTQRSSNRLNISLDSISFLKLLFTGKYSRQTTCLTLQSVFYSLKTYFIYFPGCCVQQASFWQVESQKKKSSTGTPPKFLKTSVFPLSFWPGEMWHRIQAYVMLLINAICISNHY